MHSSFSRSNNVSGTLRTDVIAWVFRFATTTAWSHPGWVLIRFGLTANSANPAICNAQKTRRHHRQPGTNLTYSERVIGGIKVNGHPGEVVRELLLPVGRTQRQEMLLTSYTTCLKRAEPSSAGAKLLGLTKNFGEPLVTGLTQRVTNRRSVSSKYTVNIWHFNSHFLLRPVSITKIA